MKARIRELLQTSPAQTFVSHMDEGAFQLHPGRSALAVTNAERLTPAPLKQGLRARCTLPPFSAP